MVKEQYYPVSTGFRSFVSSPLSSNDEKSSMSSSPSLTWSSPKGSFSAPSSHHARDMMSAPQSHHGGDTVSASSSHHGQDMVSASSSHRGRESPCSPSLITLSSKSGPSGLMQDDKQPEVKRIPSWSQYLEASGEAHAVTAERRHVVDMSQLFLGDKFASGNFSRLYRGRYKDQEVAVKVVRQPDEDEEMANRLDRQFVQEVSLLSRLHHKNIVEFVAAMRNPPVFCIIMEYLPGGSLRSFLHKNQPNVLTLETVLSLAIDISKGMEYLHSQGVLHLDLKSHNLVLGENYQVKVTDFGVARLQSECESMTPDCGTYRWMAPEMISLKNFSQKADVYGFGIILWELVTGQTPYEDMTTIQAAFAVVHKNTRPPIPESCPRPLKQLMEECWAGNPDKRPQFWQIVQRLEEFQDCTRRNVTLRPWQFDREKRNALGQLLKKCKLICAHW